MTYLLITSDSHLRTRINKLLPHACRTIGNVDDAIAAMEKAPKNEHMVVIIDEKLKKGTQMELLHALAARKTAGSIIQLFSPEEHHQEQNPALLGSVVLLAKPFCDSEFRTAMRMAESDGRLRIHESDIAQEAQPAYHTNLIGSSFRMQEVREKIRIVSAENCPVHIYGETGTGKELAVRMIHELSVPNGPFVAENCSLLEGPLAETTLFGHEKGAYTGADKDRDGLVSRANGGILFLDEVETLPLSTQAKMLRLLESGEYSPLGSSETKRSSFRLLTASNESLEAMEQENRVRKDFRFRLSGYPIFMPPLREHPEDIPELIACFQHRMHDARPFTDESLRLLLQFDWPGNVRQLFSVINRGRIRCGRTASEIALRESDFLLGSET